MDIGERHIDFDFEDTEWGVDDKDPSIIHFMQKNPDMVTFPQLKYVSSDDLGKIESLSNVYIYTEGEDFYPIEMTDVYITDVRSWERYHIEKVS